MDADKAIKAFDDLCEAVGVAPLSDTIRSLAESLPADLRAEFYKELREQMASSMKENMTMAEAELRRVANDPLIIERFRAMSGGAAE